MMSLLVVVDLSQLRLITMCAVQILKVQCQPPNKCAWTHLHAHVLKASGSHLILAKNGQRVLPLSMRLWLVRAQETVSAPQKCANAQAVTLQQVLSVRHTTHRNAHIALSELGLT